MTPVKQLLRDVSRLSGLIPEYLVTRAKTLLTMTDQHDLLRQTGRTTRMLDHAVELERHGRVVCIIAANRRHAISIQSALCKYMATSHRILHIKVEDYHDLPEFDWDTLTIHNAHPNCVVLVDHHTIEYRYQRALKEMHRFDDPEVKYEVR